MIVICGGGTGGHLAIARSFCEELNERGIKPIFIGSTSGQDKFWFENDDKFAKKFFLPSSGVVNKRGLAKLKSLTNIISLALKCRQIFKENGVKDYTHSHIVGLNLGYVVYHTENCNIGAQIGYGSNMKRKNSDWKYDYYEAMAFTDLGTCKIKPRFGLGVRHYNSRTNLYKDRTVIFASIGFGINW